MPKLHFDQIKSGDAGEVITAKLASSNSERACSIIKEVSIIDERKEG